MVWTLSFNWYKGAAFVIVSGFCPVPYSYIRRKLDGPGLTFLYTHVTTPGRNPDKWDLLKVVILVMLFFITKSKFHITKVNWFDVTIRGLTKIYQEVPLKEFFFVEFCPFSWKMSTFLFENLCVITLCGRSQREGKGLTTKSFRRQKHVDHQRKIDVYVDDNINIFSDKIKTSRS